MKIKKREEIIKNKNYGALEKILHIAWVHIGVHNPQL